MSQLAVGIRKLADVGTMGMTGNDQVDFPREFLGEFGNGSGNAVTATVSACLCAPSWINNTTARTFCLRRAMTARLAAMTSFSNRSP